MPWCFNLAALWEWWYRRAFSKGGLRSTTTDLGDGTVMHCWVPKAYDPSKPNLLLIHGVGANALWQWSEFISPLFPHFNLYVPDLVFFGGSSTTRPDRSEAFQAQCVMALMDALGVAKTMSLAGISYGGIVAYSMAAQFAERVDRVVLCCSGVCMEEKDMDEGLFQVRSVDEAISILLPRTPEKMKQLTRLTFYKSKVDGVPSFFLKDFIDVVSTVHFQEKKELIEALHKGRKMSDLPKITQPTLLIWGEHDKVFPLELAYRLKRLLVENAEIVIIKNAGHAINIEKPNEMLKHMISFLMDPLPSPRQVDRRSGDKVD